MNQWTGAALPAVPTGAVGLAIRHQTRQTHLPPRARSGAAITGPALVNSPAHSRRQPTAPSQKVVEEGRSTPTR